MGSDISSLLDDLPEDKQTGRYQLHRVVGEEVGHAPWGEGAISVEDDHKSVNRYGEVGTIWLEPATVGHLRTVHALGLAGPVVVDEGDGHDEIIDQATTGDEIDEPGNGLRGATPDLEEGQEGEQHHDTEAINRHAGFVAVAQETGSAALHSQTVEGSRGAIGIRIAGGKDGGEDQGIDDVRKYTDAHVCHGNHVRRGSCCAAVTITEVDIDKSRVIVGDHNPHSEGTDNKEDTESIIDSLKGRFDVNTWALSLGGHHRDVLRTDDTEARAPESGKKPFKTTQITRGMKLGEWTRIVPVAKPIGVVLGITADHGHKGKGEEDKN